MHKITLLLVLYQLSGAAFPSPQVLRLSHQVPAQHWIGRIIDEWVKAIETESGQNIDVKTFPGNQLMRSKSHMASVARGHIEAALIANHDWGQTIPAMGIFSRPFGFTNYEAFKSFLAQPAMTTLTQDFADKNMLNLGWIWVTGTVGITSHYKPLVAPSDFNNIKIRGVNSLPNAALVGLGAAPVSISGGEVYQALQTHLIQAAVTTLQGVYARRYDEVQEWCVKSPMFIWVFSLTVNKPWWDRLSPYQQAVIQQHSRILEQQSVENSYRELSSLPERIRERGMKLHNLTENEIEILKQYTIPAWEKTFLQQAGNQGTVLLNAYRYWQLNKGAASE